MIRVDDDGDEYEETFSFVALGVDTVEGIRAHGIGFATLAQMMDDHPVWDAVIDLLQRFCPRLPEPAKPTHLRLVHSAD